jgi:hypothetical protein
MLLQKHTLEETRRESETLIARTRAYTLRIREEEHSLTHTTVSVLMNTSMRHIDQFFGTLNGFFVDEPSSLFAQYEVRILFAVPARILDIILSHGLSL